MNVEYYNSYPGHGRNKWDVGSPCPPIDLSYSALTHWQAKWETTAIPSAPHAVLILANQDSKRFYIGWLEEQGDLFSLTQFQPSAQTSCCSYRSLPISVCAML